MRSILLILAVLSMSSAALSGCVGNDPASDSSIDEGASLSVPDSKLNLDDTKLQLQQGDSVDVPEWKIGDQFGQHIFTDPSDTAGFHIESMVIADSGSSYTLATSDQELARRHAFWDLPFLGQFSKKTLGTTAYDTDWDFMFQFPLSDNQTWTDTIEVPHTSFYWTETYDATFSVSYDAKIKSFSGTYPGFRIEANTADGLLFEYAYIPAIRWYDAFTWYDLSTEDVSDWRLRAISMGTSTGWTGEYWHDEVVQEINVFNLFCPFVTEEFCQPKDVHATFDVESSENHLFGLVVPIAWGGHVRVALRPPEGDARMFEHLHTTPPNPDEDGDDPPLEEIAVRNWIDEPALEGEWGMESAGAGFAWGGILALTEIKQVSGTLAAS